ncbi:MAG: DUF3048 domain-containing protein, partial [Clostridiales bacterium]|nr:DUF3048 domain-containing protein [Clostridiales bacterium]
MMKRVLNIFNKIVLMLKKNRLVKPLLISGIILVILTVGLISGLFGNVPVFGLNPDDITTTAVDEGNSQNSLTASPGDVKDYSSTAPAPTPDDITSSGISTSLPPYFTFPVQGVRPFAVMIDNEGTRSLPQGGLYMAQVIYEVIVEGGETRLMPVFWNPADSGAAAIPALIGPVRSSRHYFLDYIMELDAIYIHFGWSPMAKSDISKYKINNANGVANGGEIFWDLTKDKGNWQDSYTSMEKILWYVGKVKYRTTTNKQAVFNYKNSTESDDLSEKSDPSGKDNSSGENNSSGKSEGNSGNSEGSSGNEV